MSNEKARLKKKALYSNVVESYERARYGVALRLMDRVIGLTDSTRRKVIYLRERAAILGQKGEYQRQLDMQIKARRLASRAGLDSIRRKTNESIANIVAFCDSSKKCALGSRNESSSWVASFVVPGPVLLVLILCGVFAVSYLLFNEPREEAPRICYG